jgi:hypothetical protein
VFLPFSLGIASDSQSGRLKRADILSTTISCSRHVLIVFGVTWKAQTQDDSAKSTDPKKRSRRTPSGQVWVHRSSRTATATRFLIKRWPPRSISAFYSYFGKKLLENFSQLRWRRVVDDYDVLAGTRNGCTSGSTKARASRAGHNRRAITYPDIFRRSKPSVHPGNSQRNSQMSPCYSGLSPTHHDRG